MSYITNDWLIANLFQTFTDKCILLAANVTCTGIAYHLLLELEKERKKEREGREGKWREGREEGRSWQWQ